MRLTVLSLCLALAACAGEGTANRPTESPTIISVNPCSDQLLEALGADAQVMAVSHWSQDTDSASASPDWAQRFPATTGRAEELIQSHPDLILSGGLMPMQTKAILGRAGIEIRDFPVPASIGESLSQIRAMGEAIGRPDKADRLSRNIEAALAKAARYGGGGRRALVLTQSALTGEGTLIGDMLAHMDYRNAAANYGVTNLDDLRMERLLADPPEVIFIDPDNHLFDHPALENLVGRVELRPFPRRLSWCAGPTMVAMARAMEDVR